MNFLSLASKGAFFVITLGVGESVFMDITQQQQSFRIDPTLSLQLTQLLLENTSQVPQPNPRIKQAGTVCWKLPTKMSLFVNSREIWLCLDCLQFCEIPHTCQLVQVCLIRALRSLLHIISPPPQKEWVAHHPNWRPLSCSRWADRVASSKQPEIKRLWFCERGYTQSQAGNWGVIDHVLFHRQVMFHHRECSPVSDKKRRPAPHSYLKL